MQTYQVTKQQQISIRELFHGYVFRRTYLGRYYIKISKGQKKSIFKNLLIEF